MSTEHIAVGAVEPHFGMVYKAVLEHPGLNRAAKDAYMALRIFANKNTKSAYPSIRTLANLMSMGVDTTQKGLKKLVECGLLEIKKYKRDNDDRWRNYYLLHDLEYAMEAEKKKKTRTHRDTNTYLYTNDPVSVYERDRTYTGTEQTSKQTKEQTSNSCLAEFLKENGIARTDTINKGLEELPKDIDKLSFLHYLVSRPGIRDIGRFVSTSLSRPGVISEYRAAAEPEPEIECTTTRLHQLQPDELVAQEHKQQTSEEERNSISRRILSESELEAKRRELVTV